MYSFLFQKYDAGSSDNSSEWTESFFKLHEDKYSDPYWSFPKTDQIINTTRERKINNFIDIDKQSIHFYGANQDLSLNSMKNDHILLEISQSSDTGRLLRNTDHLESKMRHNSRSSDSEKALPSYSPSTHRELSSLNDSYGRRAKELPSHNDSSGQKTKELPSFSVSSTGHRTKAPPSFNDSSGWKIKELPAYNDSSGRRTKELPSHINFSRPRTKELPSFNDSSGQKATKTPKTVTRLRVRSFGHTLKNLDSDSTYDVTVAVQNIYGWSESSEVFSFYTEACGF